MPQAGSSVCCVHVLKLSHRWMKCWMKKCMKSQWEIFPNLPRSWWITMRVPRPVTSWSSWIYCRSLWSSSLAAQESPSTCPAINSNKLSLLVWLHSHFTHCFYPHVAWWAWILKQNDWWCKNLTLNYESSHLICWIFTHDCTGSVLALYFFILLFKMFCCFCCWLNVYHLHIYISRCVVHQFSDISPKFSIKLFGIYFNISLFIVLCFALERKWLVDSVQLVHQQKVSQKQLLRISGFQHVEIDRLM